MATADKYAMNSTPGGKVDADISDDNSIKVFGWMHKQGTRAFKGPVAKSWRRRFFCLEGNKIYYFHEPVDARKYFNSRKSELCIGTVDLRGAFKLEQSGRLDLPSKGIEIHTKRRVWLLCPETDAEFNMWFDALEEIIITEGSGNVVKRQLPNVREYVMKGRTSYRFFYFLFLITAIVELAGIVLWFPLGIEPCDLLRRNDTCTSISTRYSPDNQPVCGPNPFNGYWNPPAWYRSQAGMDGVQCFRQPVLAHWVSYFMFYFAEFISIILGALYYLGMWKPVRRGAQYLKDFNPPFPSDKWPSVDILLCHYAEPAEDTMATLDAILKLDYPPEKLHVYICDDGAFKTKFTPGNPIPQVIVNQGVIENAGDVRYELAHFMYEKVLDLDGDGQGIGYTRAAEMEVNEWRRSHTTVKLPTPENPRVCERIDCAIGSERDDYDYRYAGLPRVTFVGRVKPPTHHSKAGNINNVLYNEKASGRYAIILDNDMKPHPMFVQATLPFFFDSPSSTKTFRCSAPGCSDIAKISCTLCVQAGVPEANISYCSKECFDAANHAKSDIHRRQTRSSRAKRTQCAGCGGTVNPKTGECKSCHNNYGRRSSIGTVQNNQVMLAMDDHYSDDVSKNQVGYVQTPQYFEDCLQLRLGDPCGHRNSTFFDSAQTGMDGYECASFAGTNAIFRRSALDSVSGIAYGSLTEDAFTGKLMIDKGWKGLYFRKDFEGEEGDRIRLAEGAVPETVAASLAQRKRWAKGNFQIFLRRKKSLVDPTWTPPTVALPPPRKVNRFMRWVFFMNLTIYPIGSFPALFFFYITGYFLYSGNAPIYTAGLRLLVALVPKIVVQTILSAMMNRTVDNNDVMRSQETWFSYAFVHVVAVFDALYWKITDKEAAWANTGALGGNSTMELPNVLVFFSIVFGVIWSVVRFFVGYNNAETTHGTPLVFGSLFLGIFTASQLGPMVRMSLQTYFGWSHKSLTDQGNVVGSFGLAIVLSIICVWVYIETPHTNFWG
ncbi:cellulose synthase 4 [Achlya hypogyna]|uniref:Cellulose synthase 4 n=1 Tax=Achlya hypogyna TaxID=1202772 RepID=A0A1V9ZI44_ACHHY|nr:cellulose synthase 4 [Achlya hypogyna]